MNFILMHETVVNHDAVGNDIEIMYHILNNKHSCKVFAVNRFNKALKYIDEAELIQLIDKKDTVVIYHHSVFWEKGEELLEQVKGFIVFRYHNITPASFFIQYNEHHYKQCNEGREQTKRFSNRFKNAFWMSDSLYNTVDLTEVPQENISIVAPFNKIEEWSKKTPCKHILNNLFFSNELDVLFVGRIAPNKGYEFIIDVLNYYKINYNRKFMMRFVGKKDDTLGDYNQKIESKIKRYNLQDNVEFVGQITDEILIAYYLGSDIFLCASEHEGFCIPIIEAQYFGLPVIARTSSAVPDTIGKNQLLLKEDAKEYAAALHVIYSDLSYRKYLRKNGISNFKKRYFKKEIEIDFKNFFIKYLKVKI